MNKNRLQHSKIICEVEKFLNGFLVNEKKTSPYCSQMAKYQLNSGGKRIRALIPSLIINNSNKTAIALGASVEMIHNATLVHDDLQDGDLKRRGKLTVWKKYGEAQAINCGDAMFYYAIKMINGLQLKSQIKESICELALNSTLQVIEGQAQEFLMKDEKNPKISRYLGVIRGKTSGLFSLPVLIAMQALEYSKNDMLIAKNAAEGLGLLFQIQDDLLDIYGDKKRDRKATDIAEGKTSLLVAHVNENASTKDKKKLQLILKKSRFDTNQNDVTQALDVFEKYNAIGASVTHINKIKNDLCFSKKLRKIPEIRKIILDLCELSLEPIKGLI